MDEKTFFSLTFAVSLLVSFLFGYTVFRYWQIDVCKSEMRVTTFDESIYK
ncbi:MAG: hypothetical protein WC285_05120 [Candidatus Gracilibacteria bacterium]|jgi:hypothetical protein